MTHTIEIRDIINNDKPFKAYYLLGEFPMDDNEIFLGVTGNCVHTPNMCHVSFARYREYPEMVDVMILRDDIDKVFQFYAEYVAVKADEYQEEKEWEWKMNDQATDRIILNG